MSETVERYVSFTVEGSFITEIARQKLFVEKNLSAAIELLRSSLESDQLDSDEQLMLCLHVLHGSASIVGNTKDGTYGLETRDDLDERPTNLSSISKLISDMAAEIKSLKKENDTLNHKLSYLVEEISEYQLRDINAEYYEETGEKMFEGLSLRKETPVSAMVDSFLEQSKLEKDGECLYGWLEPNGTWHPVEWGEHSKWAQDWLDEHKPFEDNASIYWYTDRDGDRHHIYGIDVLIQSLNWILLENPHHGLAQMKRNESKNMTKEQKEFLFDYFMKQNRKEEAKALYEE